MKVGLAVLFIALCFAAFSEALVEQDIPANYVAFEPQLHVRHHIFNETAPHAALGAEKDKAISFLRGLCGAQSEWVVTDSYTTEHNGVTHVYLRQQYQGVGIANSPANVNFDKNGRMINAGEVCYNQKQRLPFIEPTLSPIGALLAFATHLGLIDNINKDTMQLKETPAAKSTQSFVVTNPGFGEEDIPIDLSLVQMDNGQDLRLTWHVNVRLVDYWFDAHLDAHSGQVLYMADWVKWDTYEAYGIPNLNPLLGPRIVEDNPADLTASPRGWLDQGWNSTSVFTTSAGNNLYAQLNPTGATSFWLYNYRSTGGVPRTFRAPFDTFSPPYQNRDASINNLFYWNNVIHDIFYLRGFTEQAGNFQENNFNKGGLGFDAVQANAQDGAGFNNANFATPPDGSRPKMRMYLWNQVVPNIDGDFDSGIVIHEYGHGISIRLTGGPSNVNCLNAGQAGGMGEGWGDCWAVELMQRPDYSPADAFPMGNYAAGRGIRPFPYSVDFNIDPQTYGYINRPGYDLDSNVHAKGSVWCTILNEVYWGLVTNHGFDTDWYTGTGGNNVLLQNVVDGLKLQPCTPNFVDARNAIILADQQNYGGVHVCNMWRSFARRGLGYNAVGNVKPVVENFDLPPQCL